MASAPFWVALVCQLIIVLGYFWFYRKEQLCKCLSPPCCNHPLTSTPHSTAIIIIHKTIQTLGSILITDQRTILVSSQNTLCCAWTPLPPIFDNYCNDVVHRSLASIIRL